MFQSSQRQGRQEGPFSKWLSRLTGAFDTTEVDVLERRIARLEQRVEELSRKLEQTSKGE